MGGDGGVIAANKQYMHGGGVVDPEEKKCDKKIADKMLVTITISDILTGVYKKMEEI